MLGIVTCAIAAARNDAPVVPSADKISTPASLPSASQPATTRPTGVSVRGRVTIDLGLDLQRAELSRAVVYVASDPTLDSTPLPRERSSVAQRNKLFVPNFLVIPRGAEVEFPNWDHFDHNVFSRSKAAPAFDLDRYPYGSSKSRKFDKLGVVQVFCNIHPSMRAVIFVTPNSFFARADAEGKFEISGLPPGHYELVAWHERCEEKHKAIDVASEPLEVSITLEGSRESILANAPPERRGAYGVERGLGIKRERLDLPVVEGVHPAPDKPDR